MRKRSRLTSAGRAIFPPPVLSSCITKDHLPRRIKPPEKNNSFVVSVCSLYRDVHTVKQKTIIA